MALTDSLISYWKMDEASGNALDAHSTNDLTDNDTVAAAAGIIGGARDFEKGNSGEFLSHADNASLSVTAGTAATWSAWVNLESLSAGGNFEETVLGKSDFSATTEYVLYLNSSQHWVFYAGNGTTGANADAGFAASTGVWYHIIAWYDPASSGTNNIQINGGTPVSVANTAGIYDGSAEFRIGATSTGGRRFDGLIDEVGFWKRVLTSTERSQLYNGGAGLAYPLQPWDVVPRVKPSAVSLPSAIARSFPEAIAERMRPNPSLLAGPPPPSPDPNWFPLQTHIHTMPGPTPREPGWTLHPKWSPAAVEQVTTTPGVQAKIRIDHDEHADHKRSRQHEQDVAMLINALARSGELIGTVRDPALGYHANDITKWSGLVAPTGIKEALDRIAVALAALGHKP